MNSDAFVSSNTMGRWDKKSFGKNNVDYEAKKIIKCGCYIKKETPFYEKCGVARLKIISLGLTPVTP